MIGDKNLQLNVPLYKQKKTPEKVEYVAQMNADGSAKLDAAGNVMKEKVVTPARTEIVPVKKNEQHIHDIVVANSRPTVEKVHDLVKGKGYENVKLYTHEQLTNNELQQVIDPTFMVHPEDWDTQATLFNLRRQCLRFVLPSRWEEAGLNQELEFIVP